QNKIRFFELSGDRFNDLTGASLLGPSGPIPYLNYETMLGAVFADDPKIYACTIDRAWTNWNIVTKVFIEKFNSIAPLYQGTACEGFYKDNFDMLSIRDTTEHGFNLESSGLESDLGDLGAAVQSLGRTNERAQLSSCPLIY
ncbi:MAG: hypothetical protein KJ574_04865, partial [Nanoarchaeota archaeon]|nr:hypothetical protein [Nanoarchaeota archaeon]